MYTTHNGVVDHTKIKNIGEETDDYINCWNKI